MLIILTIAMAIMHKSSLSLADSESHIAGVGRLANFFGHFEGAFDAMRMNNDSRQQQIVQ